MPETKRRLKVFLCHAHSDAAAVHDLFRYLKREGVDVWLDKEKLLPGADWDLEIRKAVRESDAVVVCLSKQFDEAGYRQKEVRIALDAAMEQPEGQIFIIPTRLEECDTLESLRKWHWVDLFEEGGRQKLIYALRARAKSVGAELRKHSGRRSSEPAPQHEKYDEDDYIPAPARPNPADPHGQSTVALDLPAPPGGLVSLEKTEEQTVSRRQVSGEEHSGFWIDGSGQVYRDSEKISFWHPRESESSPPYDEWMLKLFTYLVKHKGEICTYRSLIEAIWESEAVRSLYEGGLISQIDMLIALIRSDVQVDPLDHETLVGITKVGYMLRK